MNRGLHRLFIVATAVLVLSFTVVPSASALPRQASRAAFDAPAHWLTGVMNRVTELFAGRSPQLRERTSVKSLLEPLPPESYTGVCIDPWGNKYPCPGGPPDP